MFKAKISRTYTNIYIDRTITKEKLSLADAYFPKSLCMLPQKKRNATASMDIQEKSVTNFNS